MLTLVEAIKSETPCEPELLLFAGMNDHLHAAGLLEHLKGEAPTKVAFTTSLGYASMPPRCSFDLDSGRERVADTCGSSQSRAGADKLETF